MTPDDLDYIALSERLKSLRVKERDESATFLRWFLENIYRLEETDAIDSVCDGPGDQGVDGIYVDHNNAEIQIMQTKLRQRADRSIGDSALREMHGVVEQFTSADNIKAMLEGGANPELRKLINRLDLFGVIGKGYRAKGVYITNTVFASDAVIFAEQVGIELYDRNRIAEEYIELFGAAGIEEWADFDISDIGAIEYSAGSEANVYIFLASTSDLLSLKGLSDGSLFSQNVRLSLGNTKVNKDISKTITDKSEHISFPLYHNGITLLCDQAIISEDKLRVKDYVVVNGAQSLSVIFHNKASVTSDLRVLVKAVEVKGNRELASRITTRSNNQNPTKPRDMRSNHPIQARLKEEFQRINYKDYAYEIKRGEALDGTVITNEEAGGLLLAFDLQEPWSCHQVYKLFDEKYADIFGRPEVNAARIILLHIIMDAIIEEMSKLENEALAGYKLTRYFLLFCLSKIIRKDDIVRKAFAAPEKILADERRLQKLIDGIRSVTTGAILDLNHEANAEDFDYKSSLKSGASVQRLMDEIVKSYEKDVARNRQPSLGTYVV